MGERVHKAFPCRATACVALLAALCLLAAGVDSGTEPAAAAKPKGPQGIYFGYNEDWVAHSERLRFVARGGADTTRAVISWSQVEKTEGVYHWHRYDRMYARMLRTGTRPLWVLGDAPCWAQAPRADCGGRSFAHPPAPAHDTAFAIFAAQVAYRYPQAVAIETWNEPNLWSFWRPEPDPERAAVVSAWAGYGVKYVNPQMPVLFGGLAPSLENVPHEQVKYKSFLRRVYAEVGPGYWDAVAMHPFPSFQKSTHYLREIVAHLDRVRAALHEAGAPGTPIWVTEIGLSTEGLRPYSQAEQAKGLVRIYRGLARMADVPAVIVHRLIDQPRGLKTAESGWGVVRRGGGSKPAYCALAEARGERCEDR